MISVRSSKETVVMGEIKKSKNTYDHFFPQKVMFVIFMMYAQVFIFI